MLGPQKCSESKLFMFSSCRAYDQRPPAKKLWLMGSQSWRMWDHLLHCPLSQQERGPREVQSLIQVSHTPQNVRGFSWWPWRSPACPGAGVMMLSSSPLHLCLAVIKGDELKHDSSKSGFKARQPCAQVLPLSHDSPGLLGKLFNLSGFLYLPCCVHCDRH